MQLDSIDIKILDTLVDDGRASVESVAERILIKPDSYAQANQTA